MTRIGFNKKLSGRGALSMHCRSSAPQSRIFFDFTCSTMAFRILTRAIYHKGTEYLNLLGCAGLASLLSGCALRIYVQRLVLIWMVMRGIIRETFKFVPIAPFLFFLIAFKGQC